MTANIRGIARWVAAAGLAIALGPQSWAHAQIGRKISVGDYPSMKEGSPGLVLIEVSDFQCGYCGQSARGVLPSIKKNFVHTGQVELVFLDLPLQMHSQAFKAAVAAACARDQNKFWEMHDVLFENQRALTPDRFPGYAETLGLDLAAFQKCLSGRRHDGEIRGNIRVANSLDINGTPAYVLARRIPGADKVQVLEIVHGVRPYEEMEQKLNALLASK
ncbi:MAG TPA: thioredoxin domain-containing protein [Thermoanaerobaculia bacterium]|jgi:protein-disulfide isomerase|nr:thioredoxin domain-containing protein [Thermoanaerobaculia bacterium]